MTVYEFEAGGVGHLKEAFFAADGLLERALQRLLRGQIDMIPPDTLVMSEEFGDWESCSGVSSRLDAQVAKGGRHISLVQ